MTQWKTHMCQIYFALLPSLQVFGISDSYSLGSLKLYFSFPHFNSQPWDHQNLFWCFPALARRACQDASVPPSAPRALNPSSSISKGPKWESMNNAAFLFSTSPLSGSLSLKVWQPRWHSVTFKEMELRNLFSFSRCFKKRHCYTGCFSIMTSRQKSARSRFLPNSRQQPSLSRWHKKTYTFLQGTKFKKKSIKDTILSPQKW